MNTAALDLQQARIKQILFKSQLRSMLYGVREVDDALFSPHSSALGQWLANVVRPKYPTRPEVREAEHLFHRMLSTGRALVSQYRQGHIEESRRGLSQIDGYGEQFVSAMQRLAQHPAQAPAA